MEQIAGVILAGGQSSRMGQDKAELKRDGQTMLQFNQALLTDIGIKQVFVSRNCDGYIRDVIASRGPLAGIYSVLLHIKQHSNCKLAIILAVDMPLLNQELITQLCLFGLRHQRPACYSDNFFPLFLPINSQVLDYLRQQLFSSDGNLKVKGLINAFDGDFIKHQYHQRLMNTNTPQQWLQSQLELGDQE